MDNIEQFLGPLGLTAFVLVSITVISRYAWKILQEYIAELKRQIAAGEARIALADARAERWEGIASTASNEMKAQTISLNKVLEGVAELIEIAQSRSGDALKQAVETIVNNLNDQIAVSRLKNKKSGK